MPAVSEHDRPAELRNAGGRYPPGGPTPRASRAASLTDAPSVRRRRTLVVREHDALTGIDETERRELERFALAQPTDADGERRPVLALRNGLLHARNYVGIIETRRGTVIEMLPKIDLANGGIETEGPDTHPGEGTEGSTDSSTTRRHEDTRRVFLTMLRIGAASGKRSSTPPASVRSVVSTCSKPSSTCS